MCLFLSNGLCFFVRDQSAFDIVIGEAQMAFKEREIIRTRQMNGNGQYFSISFMCQLTGCLKNS